MPATQRNFNYFAYTDDDGDSWSLRADQDWGNNTISGGTPAAGEQVFGRQTVRRAPRKVIFHDPTTFRTFTGPVFTAAAMAAITLGVTTLSVFVPGLATAVSYIAVKKVAERKPSPVVKRQNADHA